MMRRELHISRQCYCSRSRKMQLVRIECKSSFTDSIIHDRIDCNVLRKMMLSVLMVVLYSRLTSIDPPSLLALQQHYSHNIYHSKYHRSCCVTILRNSIENRSYDGNIVSDNPTIQVSKTTNTNDNNNHNQNIYSPFQSRYYPPISPPIPFRQRRRKNETNTKQIFFWWLPGQKNWTRQRFKQLQEQRIQKIDSNMIYDIEWLDSDDVDHNNEKRTITKSRTTNSNSEGACQNIILLVQLWNIIANFTTTATARSRVRQQEQRKLLLLKDKGNMNEWEYIKVIGVPNMQDEYILEQFVDMLQWLFDQHRKDNDKANYHCTTLLNIHYNTTSVVDNIISIPTITLSMMVLPSPQHQPSNPSNNDDYNSSTIQNQQLQQYKIDNDNSNDLDAATIVYRTKCWVQRILEDHTICPFTKSTTFSGQGLSDVNVPVARIAYYTSNSNNHTSTNALNNCIDESDTSTLSFIHSVCRLQADVWMSIYDMIQAGSIYKLKQQLDGISSILLAAPGWDNNFAQWTRVIFPLLENCVQIMQLSDQIGIVCFHPYYQTPDGRSFPGFGHMHSVPRLLQWFQEHASISDIHNAINKTTSYLITSNMITSTNDNISSIDNATTSTTWNDQRIVSYIVTAGGAWQRRTPHATINILRAEQLAAAESKRTTPKLYTNNILRLCNSIGWFQLDQSFNEEREINI